MKLLKTIAATIIILFISCTSYAGKKHGYFGTDDVNTSINCKINNVILLAKSEIDCSQAGGEAEGN